MNKTPARCDVCNESKRSTEPVRCACIERTYINACRGCEIDIHAQYAQGCLAHRDAMNAAYNKAMRERSCTAHYKADPRQAETVMHGRVTYIVLRCTVCERPQGMRLVRKVAS